MRGSENRFAGRIALLLAFLLALAFVARPAAADEGRVALIIGNAAYKVAPQLTNPVFDAKAVAASFKQLGFKVFEGYDLSTDQMRSVVSEFSAALSGSGGAVVYYAGHGVSFDGENYLLPTDIDLKTPTDLDLNAISVTQLLRQMRREERANVVILDACRDNPFAAELTRGKYRGLMSEHGLNAVGGDLARGALIAFASDPNATAFDGEPGHHSPFTKALIDHLEDQGVSIDTVMQRVRSQVWESTRKQQLPWVNTSIIGEFDLNPAKQTNAVSATPSPAPAEAQTTENLLWESAQRSNLAADYQAYLDAFPNGVFAAMARNRIAAVAAPPSARSSTGGGVKTANLEDRPEETERLLNLGLTERKELQLRLIALKYDAGQADGDFGDRARAAIREWQTRRGLSPTGYFNASEVAALNAESEASYQQLVARPARAVAPHVAPSPRASAHAAPSYGEPRQDAPLRRRCRPGDPGCGSAYQTGHRPTAEGVGGAEAHQSAAPAQHPAGDQYFLCQQGFHNVSAPTPSGYRCVQDGY
jgi:uncharacterized caspase-like protein